MSFVSVDLALIIHCLRYGGPGSQLTDLKFNRDWDHYVACGLQYIVVIVDGRGTGYKGRKLRNPVRNNLGYFETRDQINAAKSVDWPIVSRQLNVHMIFLFEPYRLWASKDYVDPKRIGIWGWVSAANSLRFTGSLPRRAVVWWVYELQGG